MRVKATKPIPIQGEALIYDKIILNKNVIHRQ